MIVYSKIQLNKYYYIKYIVNIYINIYKNENLVVVKYL